MNSFLTFSSWILSGSFYPPRYKHLTWTQQISAVGIFSDKAGFLCQWLSFSAFYCCFIPPNTKSQQADLGTVPERNYSKWSVADWRQWGVTSVWRTGRRWAQRSQLPMRIKTCQAFCRVLNGCIRPPTCQQQYKRSFLWQPFCALLSPRQAFVLHLLSALQSSDCPCVTCYSLLCVPCVEPSLISHEERVYSLLVLTHVCALQEKSGLIL